jgi:glycine dehydrogenase subunit 1
MHDENTCCVVVQSPNYFGCIEDCFEIEKVVHSQKKALFIPIVDPISLAVLNAPSEYNADIVVGEGQALGNRMYYGGPLFGFLATKMDLNRNMPGRIVGATVDADGKRAFVLTLQAREQHIRRDKATSNICSNEALCTLAGAVYMCLMGKQGLKEVAERSMVNAHYLQDKICHMRGFDLAFKQPFFKEFTVKMPYPPENLVRLFKDRGVYPGIELSDTGYDDMMLICATEKKTKAEMDCLKEMLQGFELCAF